MRCLFEMVDGLGFAFQKFTIRGALLFQEYLFVRMCELYDWMECECVCVCMHVSTCMCARLCMHIGTCTLAGLHIIIVRYLIYSFS